MQVAGDSKPSGGFQPIHEAHAIEQVAFLIQFENSLQDDEFSVVRSQLGPFQDELPGRAEFQAAFVFGAISSPGQVSPSQSVGTVLQRVGPDGSIEKELRIERNGLTFRSLQYSRWQNVWASAKRYFEVLGPTYLTRSRLATVGLTYVDKFVWGGDMNDCRPGFLLRPDSKYLSPCVYDAGDLWHSHVGAFIRSDGKTRRLLNVNADCIDENRPGFSPRRVTAITTALTDMFNQPMFESTKVAPDAFVNFIELHMEQLHSFNKEIIGGIISDEMSARVALKD